MSSGKSFARTTQDLSDLPMVGSLDELSVTGDPQIPYFRCPRGGTGPALVRLATIWRKHAEHTAEGELKKTTQDEDPILAKIKETLLRRVFRTDSPDQQPSTTVKDTVDEDDSGPNHRQIA